MHVLLHLDAPSVSLQMLPRLNDHVTHPLSLIHERSAERLGTGPRLRASTVEIDARDEGRDEGGCAGEFLGVVGAELDNGGRLDACGVDCEVCISQLPSVPVSIFIHVVLCVEMMLVADEMRDAPLSLAN